MDGRRSLINSTIKEDADFNFHAEADLSLEDAKLSYLRAELQSYSNELDNWIETAKNSKLDQLADILQQTLNHIRFFSVGMYRRNHSALYHIVKEHHQFIKSAMTLLFTRQKQLDSELCTYLDAKQHVFTDKFKSVLD